MKKYVFTFFVISSLFACSKDESRLEPTELNFEIIADDIIAGGNSGYLDQQALVIDDTTTYNSLTNDMVVANAHVTPEFYEIVVDFDEYTVLAFIDEVRNYGGHHIEIISIVENEENITVDVDYVGTGTNAIVNQPYLIVKIAKTSKPVLFI